MKHEERRKETGKMLMDISKYMVTVCFIGGILTEKISFSIATQVLVVAIAIFLIGFYVIPARKEGT